MIEKCHQVNYHPLIILITAYEHYSIKGIKNGVFDYLLKPIDLDELNVTIQRLRKELLGDIELNINLGGDLSSREKELL